MGLPCSKDRVSLPPEILHWQHLAVLTKRYPSAVAILPSYLHSPPDETTSTQTSFELLSKFCYFSGGPINENLDVYYEASYGEGGDQKLYMLALLSPPQTPEEFIELAGGVNNGFKTIDEFIQAEDKVYELNPQDFEELRSCHKGKCDLLDPEVLTPGAWIVKKPRVFIDAREKAMELLVEAVPPIVKSLPDPFRSHDDLVGNGREEEEAMTGGSLYIPQSGTVLPSHAGKLATSVVQPIVNSLPGPFRSHNALFGNGGEEDSAMAGGSLPIPQSGTVPPSHTDKLANYVVPPIVKSLPDPFRSHNDLFGNGGEEDSATASGSLSIPQSGTVLPFHAQHGNHFSFLESSLPTVLEEDEDRSSAGVCSKSQRSQLSSYYATVADDEQSVYSISSASVATSVASSTSSVIRRDMGKMKIAAQRAKELRKKGEAKKAAAKMKQEEFN